MYSIFTDAWRGVGHSDLVWSSAKSISFNNSEKSDNKVDVYSLWDNDSLYFAFRVEDKNLIAYRYEKDHPLLYLDDMIEVLIDAFNDKGECWSVDDIVYHINLLGQKKDDRGTKDCLTDLAWDGEASYSVKLMSTLNNPQDIDHGYRVEIAIPWNELGVHPETGDKIGVNFANGDNDGNGRQLFDWANAWPLRTPSQFGTLLLQVQEKEDKWREFQRDSVVSSLDNYINRFHYYKSSSSEKKPLLVSIHQWSADYTNFRNSMAEQAKAEDWNYIFPDARGANNHPKACGSDYVISDIDQAIEWAVEHLPVDTSAIYVVGASGGGYNALCHFLKSSYPVKEYSVWAPITDLKSWYYESLHRNKKYAQDIKKCLCVNCSEFQYEMAEARSPFYWSTPKGKLSHTKLHIYAGIHDGYIGTVPISHSIRFYNKVAKDMNAEESKTVSADEMIWMLTTRTAPYSAKHKKIGERNILFEKQVENLSLTIFEGGHEILVNEVIETF
jgi:pimeloyl-ACP methyl ester carboxylesterase